MGKNVSGIEAIYRQKGGESLREAWDGALELWARVLSCPEPGLAIAGFGKRDAPYDIGLPVVRSHADVQVEALNDQHAYLRDPGGVLAVGDSVVCGISHPCTAFDKWRLIPVVDDDYTVVDAVATFF